MGWKIFRGMTLAAAFCAAIAWTVAVGAEDRSPVFHFDFKDAAGKTITSVACTVTVS